NGVTPHRLHQEEIPMSATSEALHRKSVVIDGLVFFSDGDTRDMLAGGVSAINLTVTEMSAGFEEALRDAVTWRERALDPSSSWLLVQQAGDIALAKQQGKLGHIMGWQSAKPLGDQVDRVKLFHTLGDRKSVASGQRVE